MSLQIKETCLDVKEQHKIAIVTDTHPLIFKNVAKSIQFLQRPSKLHKRKVVKIFAEISAAKWRRPS